MYKVGIAFREVRVVRVRVRVSPLAYRALHIVHGLCIHGNPRP